MCEKNFCIVRLIENLGSQILENTIPSISTCNSYDKQNLDGFKNCFLYAYKHDKGDVKNSTHGNSNILAVLECKNIKYKIVAEVQNKALSIYFASSEHKSDSILTSFLSLSIFEKISCTFHVLFMLFTGIFMQMKLLKGYLLKDYISGVRNRNCYNKTIFIHTIHAELFAFIYRICLWVSKNEITEINIYGSSCGGSFALFSIGEFMKALFLIKHKIDKINYYGLFSAGVNLSSYEILNSNINEYLGYSKNTLLTVNQLSTIGDFAIITGYIFPHQKLIELFNNRVCYNLYILNAFEHDFWHNGQFIKHNFENSFDIGFHQVVNFNTWLQGYVDIYKIRNTNIDCYIHLLTGGCNIQPIGNNSDVSDRFFSIVGCKYSILKTSLEFDNLSQFCKNIAQDKQEGYTDIIYRICIKIIKNYLYISFIPLYLQMVFFTALYNNLLEKHIIFVNLMLRTKIYTVSYLLKNIKFIKTKDNYLANKYFNKHVYENLERVRNIDDLIAVEIFENYMNIHKCLCQYSDFI